MVVIHADASTKNGYSCWVFKSNLMKSCKFGIIRTSNSMVAETLAIIKAIEFHKPKDIGYEPILIVSDCFIPVRIIQQQNDNYNYSESCSTLYKKTRDRLRNLLLGREIESLWINSKNTHPDHIEVDHISKTELDKYLNKE